MNEFKRNLTCEEKVKPYSRYFYKEPDFSVLGGLAMHNVNEYTNLASFLPQIYQEQKGLIQ